jgi:Fe2+ or Zn2+ uptake regulation protein
MARPPRTKSALARLVAGGDRHDWSIDELRSGLAREGVEVDFSTVFRAVEGMVAAGELNRVQLGTSDARFEAAGDHHEHVRCDRCGAVAAVATCAVEGAIPEVERATGFRLRGHDLVFHGICPSCRERG